MTEEQTNGASTEETQPEAPKFIPPRKWEHKRIAQLVLVRASGLPFESQVWQPTEQEPEIPAAAVAYYKYVREDILIAFDGAENPLFSIDPKWCLISYGPCTAEEEERENRPALPQGPPLSAVEKRELYSEILAIAEGGSKIALLDKIREILRRVDAEIQGAN